MTHELDLFATKGIEYLLVIGFLLALTLFWRVLQRTPRAAAVAARGVPAPWFRLARGRLYHPGHTWALPESDDVVTVGIDDFAQRLLGRATGLELPPVGSRVEQGAPGLAVRVGSSALPLLSPVDGEVLAVNDEALRSPQLVNDDPYGSGWLLKARVARPRSNFRNLLRDETARAWMEETVAALRRRLAGELGPVLQDGGTPVVGLARAISPEGWEQVAREFLLGE